MIADSLVTRCQICASATAEFMRISTQGLDEAFLDEALRHELPSLILNRCTGCGALWSGDARQNQELLTNAYERMSGDYFAAPTDRPTYVAFYRWMESVFLPHAPGETLLDIGCGDGYFLRCLSNHWNKEGIEPSRSGAALAQSYNLNVKCGVLETTSVDTQSPVHVLTALDVIEHIAQPATFVKTARERLATDGLLVLVTGDSESVTARWAGNRWLYLRWCGHVAVLSKPAMLKLLADNGFEVLAWHRCSHPASPGIVAWLRVALLEPVRRLFARPKSWFPFLHDHQLVVARKIS